MQKFSYTITDEIGLHARPAGELVKVAQKFGSKVTLGKDGKTADATRLIAIMGLGVKKGDALEVCVEGADEADAAAELKKFFSANL